MSIERKIKNNIPLARFTTFKIGGPAEFLIETENKEELKEAIKWARANDEKVTLLAGGSNILISDAGIKGLVIRLLNKNLELKGERIECGASAPLSGVSMLAVNNGFTGLEWAVGVPGAIGGAVWGNAGAYGLYISDSVETVEVFNQERQEFRIFSKKDCAFSYKESIFKKEKNLIIWSITLKLKKGHLDQIKKQANQYKLSRERSQPKLPNAGCIFKNISFDYLNECNPKLAEMAAREKKVKRGKVSAGWLIDLLGLKGKRMGDAKVSLEHANFIVNTGQAKANEVIMLISYLKQQVRDRFKVQLQEEIQYL